MWSGTELLTFASMHVIQCECGGNGRLLKNWTLKRSRHNCPRLSSSIKRSITSFWRRISSVMWDLASTFWSLWWTTSIKNRCQTEIFVIRWKYVLSLFVHCCFDLYCIPFVSFRMKNDDSMFIYLILLFACSSCSSTTTNRNHFPLFLQYCFGSWLEHLNRSSLSTHSCPITRNASVNYNQCM